VTKDLPSEKIKKRGGTGTGTAPLGKYSTENFPDFAGFSAVLDPHDPCAFRPPVQSVNYDIKWSPIETIEKINIYTVNPLIFTCPLFLRMGLYIYIFNIMGHYIFNTMVLSLKNLQRITPLFAKNLPN
jgi:hypothetical protein